MDEPGKPLRGIVGAHPCGRPGGIPIRRSSPDKPMEQVVGINAHHSRPYATWNPRPQFVQDQRREKGIEIIPLDSSARRVLRVLQRNQLVALVVDRPLDARHGVEVSLFGQTTYVPAGPAMLAFKIGKQGWSTT